MARNKLSIVAPNLVVPHAALMKVREFSRPVEGARYRMSAFGGKADIGQQNMSGIILFDLRSGRLKTC